MKTPFFSVIVPMYNVEKYARQCIESILAQSFADFEIILVDDGSKDSTPKILDEYEKKDERVKVIRKRNGGVNAARKSGLEAANGKYVALVDGDDCIHGEYLQKFASAIEEYPDTKFFSCGYCCTNDAGEIIKRNSYKTVGYLSNELLEKEIRTQLFSFPFSVWAKVFSRELYFEFQMRVDDCITLGEDLSIVIPMLYNINSAYVLPDFLYYYRYNPKSITKNRKKEWRTDGLLARIKLLENSFDLNSHNLESQLAVYVSHATMNQCLSYFKANAYSIAKQKTKSLLEIDLIKKYVYRDDLVESKKEKVARFALKKKLWFLLKLYTFFW